MAECNRLKEGKIAAQNPALPWAMIAERRDGGCMTDDEAMSLHLKLVEYHLDKAKIAVIESARGFHLTLARKFCDEARRTNQRAKNPTV